MQHCGAGALDEFDRSGGVMGSEVVQDNDVARSEFRYEVGSEPLYKAGGVHGFVIDFVGNKPLQPDGPDDRVVLAALYRSMTTHALAARGATVRAGQGDVRPALVEEDKVAGRQLVLVRLREILPRVANIRPFDFTRAHGLLFRVQPTATKTRDTAERLTTIPRSRASASCHSWMIRSACWGRSDSIHAMSASLSLRVLPPPCGLASINDFDPQVRMIPVTHQPSPSIQRNQRCAANGADHVHWIPSSGCRCISRL